MGIKTCLFLHDADGRAVIHGCHSAPYQFSRHGQFHTRQAAMLLLEDLHEMLHHLIRESATGFQPQDLAIWLWIKTVLPGWYLKIAG